MMRLWLPLLAHCCFIVSISTPESLAFLMADVARGQPDRLEAKKQGADEDLQHIIQEFLIALGNGGKKLRANYYFNTSVTQLSPLFASAPKSGSILPWLRRFQNLTIFYCSTLKNTWLFLKTYTSNNKE